MCQIITQNTICNTTTNDNLNSSQYVCKCPYEKYFDIINNKCKNKNSFNQTCTYNSMCLDTLGLLCSNGIFKWAYLLVFSVYF